MALHDYATELLGNKATIFVLKTLLRYRGKNFTIRDLARNAGISHTEASNVLRRLGKRGIVRISPIGRAYQVTLNDESYALKTIIEPAFLAEERTISSIVSTLKPFFHNKRGISSVAIFGSVAKGLEKGSSDIDLLVLAQDVELANECVSRASTTILGKFGFSLSPSILTKRKLLLKSNEELKNSILESYIQVCGRELRDVL